MKKILALLLFVTAAMLLQQKSEAQQIMIDTFYHLFFYKGEKIKENVLRTPQGDVVTYDPAKRILKKVSKSGIGKELDNMLAEVNKTDQRMKEMMQKLAGSLPRTVAPYYAKPLNESYDAVKEIYADALSNKMEMPEIPESELIKRGKGVMERLEIETANVMAQIKVYMEKYKNAPPEVPTPPEKDFRYCSQCDKQKKILYDTLVQRFDRALKEEEEKLLSIIYSNERSWQLAGGDENKGSAEREAAEVFISRRLGQKANLLLKKFGNDPLRLEVAVSSALGLERERQLTGIPETDAESLKMAEVAPILKNLLNYLDKAVDEKDYTIALNPGLILSCFRQYMLMGGSDKDVDNMTIIEKALNLNSFKLNIKVSGKLSGSGFMQLAELKGDNYFAAVIDSATSTTCRLKWVLLGPDPEKKHMQFDLTDVKMQGGGKEIVYAGTKKWKSPVPKLRIDFCDNGNDTAMITSFRPDGKETWIVPEYGPMDAPYMSNVLLGCFMDIDRIKKEANKEEMAKKMEEMKRKAEEFKKNYAAGQRHSASQMSNMITMSKALSAGSMVSDMMQEYAVGSYLILPKPQNKDKVVFKERLNGKELFPENPKIEYGWFDITLEQDPDSPYKLKMPW
jgi:hypothetical protein